MVDQTEERAADAESPVNDPYAKDVPLLFIENAFKSGEDGSAAHEKETEVNVECCEDQRGEKDGQKTGVLHNSDALEVPLNDTARKELLNAGGEDIDDRSSSDRSGERSS